MCGTSSVNWRGIVHRCAGQVAGIAAQVHFGTYNVNTSESPEIGESDAHTIQTLAAVTPSQAADAALVSAIQGTAWSSWWSSTATALTNAGAPAGTLLAACRDWFGAVTF